MQVVDTNRSKASFKRLNKQTLEGSAVRKRNRAENKKETKRSIVKVSVESRICAVVRVRRKVQAGNSLKDRSESEGKQATAG